MHRPLIAVAALLALASPGRARAFSTSETFDTPVVGADGPSGGGGGRRFTGSIRDGYTCAVCHHDATAAEWTVEGLPLDGYTPRAEYEITVSWPPGSLALSALELVGADGSAAGTLALPDEATLADDERCPSGSAAGRLVEAEPRRTVLTHACTTASRLRAIWTAPGVAGEDDAGGVVSVHAVTVRGNGSADPLGDAFASRRELLRPAGAPAPEISVGEGGACAAGGEGRGWPAPIALVLLASLARLARRRPV